jgi:hypothetical protein
MHQLWFRHIYASCVKAIILYYITLLLLWNKRRYLLVNESEGSLYNIIREKRLTQSEQHRGSGWGEGGKQTIFCLDNVIIIVVSCVWKSSFLLWFYKFILAKMAEFFRHKKTFTILKSWGTILNHIIITLWEKNYFKKYKYCTFLFCFKSLI